MKYSRKSSTLIDRYLCAAVVPYIALALFLLSAVLYAQQSNRFAELLLVARLPSALTFEIAFDLIPTVLTFAVPTALLTGILIGYSRMGGDSEIVAMRAAGAGTWNMARAPLLIGITACAAMLYTGMAVAPRAAASLRRVGLRVALYKLDSPVEPKTFNTEIAGKVIYVREGDQDKGEWGKVFIYSQEKNGDVTYLTARAGRIDSVAEQSELVLSDAARTTLPKIDGSGDQSFITERLAQVRLRLPSGRTALLDQLRQDHRELDEMSGGELWQRAWQKAEGREQKEAAIMFNRRAALACAPMVFALLGAGIGLRLRRGGRGLGIIISLVVLFSYYLVSLGCEQLARAGALPIWPALWLANALTLCLGLSLLKQKGGRGGASHLSRAVGRRLRGGLGFKSSGTDKRAAENQSKSSDAIYPNANTRRTRISPRVRYNFLSLLDRSLLQALTFYFALAMTALIALFMVFTAFELWKYIAATGAGAMLVGRYLFYLLPLTIVSITPTSLLIAALATYALLARRSEALAWWSSGQSAYRLALPGVIFAMVIGVALWQVQERVMPRANQKQDALRAAIRNGITRTETPLGRQWLASADGRRIYNFEYDDRTNSLIAPVVYDFDDESVHLRRVVMGADGHWVQSQSDGKKGALALGGVVTFDLAARNITTIERAPELRIEDAESAIVFKPSLNKPSQLSARALSEYMQALKARGALTPDLVVALARKKSEPCGPLVMALVGIPFALAFGRRSAVAALAMAILIGVCYWGISGAFQQLGVYALLPPQLAAWSPTIIFAALGIYLLSRMRT